MTIQPLVPEGHLNGDDSSLASTSVSLEFSERELQLEHQNIETSKGGETGMKLWACSPFEVLFGLQGSS